MTEAVRIARRELPVTPGKIEGDLLLTAIGRDDPVILDIGCNDGTHTLWFLDLFPRGRVFSFEPDPRPRQRYAEKVTSERAELFDLAISDRDGAAEFFVSSGGPDGHWDESGSIRKPKRHLDVYPWVKFEEKTVVNTSRLDTWAKTVGVDSVDLIWADVQGAEIDLIKGGTETLRNTRYLYTEYSNRELYEGQISLKSLLKSLPDFEVVRIFEGDVLLRNSRLSPKIQGPRV